MIDAHDIVVRVNNYKLFPQTGFRTDVFYSFFGNSIAKTSTQLQHDGVGLCLCKCPNTQVIESEWHRRKKQMAGVDFRWIYETRKDWWFCDTYIPDKDDFMAKFELLGNHVPTTGFAALLDILSFGPRWLYLTGFDFFRSHRHNVNEPWRKKNHDDPIGHVPERELAWLRTNIDHLPISTDMGIAQIVGQPTYASTTLHVDEGC